MDLNGPEKNAIMCGLLNNYFLHTESFIYFKSCPAPTLPLATDYSKLKPSSSYKKIYAPPLFQILKDEQRTILECLIDKKDCIAVLQTGFGKSLPFQIYSLINRTTNDKAIVCRRNFYEYLQWY
jgi:hypothetical protein